MGKKPTAFGTCGALGSRHPKRKPVVNPGTSAAAQRRGKHFYSGWLRVARLIGTAFVETQEQPGSTMVLMRGILSTFGCMLTCSYEALTLGQVLLHGKWLPFPRTSRPCDVGVE